MTVTHRYMTVAASMPWQLSTSDELQLETAQQTLDREHHGLPKVMVPLRATRCGYSRLQSVTFGYSRLQSVTVGYSRYVGYI